MKSPENYKTEAGPGDEQSVKNKRNFGYLQGAVLSGALVFSSAGHLQAQTVNNDKNKIRIKTESSVNYLDPAKVDLIDKLRANRIKQLNDLIEFYESSYKLSSDFEEFHKQKILEHESSKKELEIIFKKWRAINIDKFSNEQVALLIDYILCFQRDALVPLDQKATSGEPNNLGLRESYQSKEIKKIFNQDKSLARFYAVNIAGDNNLREHFQEKIDSIDVNINPKVRFKTAVERIISDLNDNILITDSELENRIKEDWNASESPEEIELKLDKTKDELDRTTVDLNYKNLKDIINSSHSWILENIISNAYLEKLIKGEDYSPEEAKNIQKDRYARAKDAPVDLDEKYFSFSRYEKDENNKIGKIIINPYDLALYPLSIIQEREHQLTDENKGISKKAQEIYSKALLSDTDLKQIINNNPEIFPINLDYPGISYWTNITEIDSRKKVLEFSLITKFALIKTGEIMTHEHYLKLLELMAANKLDHNTVQLILITTEDGLLNIVNKIA